MAKRGKRRIEFRKNHQGRVRDGDLTRDYREGRKRKLDEIETAERLSGKGKLTRRRTVKEEPRKEQDGELRSGRVVSVHGHRCKVAVENGEVYECAIRQVLKSLSIDGRSAVVAGDLVRFRATSNVDGMIEHVEPRSGVLCRTSKNQQHIIASNVDQLMIVSSLASPSLKPVLIDRYLLTAFQCDLQPTIVLNKADLVDLAEVQQLVGVYCSMGIEVLITSADTGLGVDLLRERLEGKQTALSGQSGVGKSSLLNAVQPGLGLAVGRISDDNNKGRHTTTATQLIPVEPSGWVFDTPGIRQFKLWDVEASEVAGLMPDFVPYVSHCRYPDCLHLNEDACAVKDAVIDGRIDARRYDAYCHLLETDLLVED
ncbi:MAG: ribosome small subunit-dependent GTPase A [Planctomycetota bacterium]